MFEEIQKELNILVESIRTSIMMVQGERLDSMNPYTYIEYGGRMTGLAEALVDIDAAQNNINNHINNILSNTIDGNYEDMIRTLENENRVLAKKNTLLNAKIAKVKKAK